MFKDYKLNYNNSTDKKIKNNYLKEIHKRIIEFKDVNQLDGFKIINSISFDEIGPYIELNNQYKNIKMYINDQEYENVVMYILCFGNYEELETKMVLKILNGLNKDNFAFCDIGANLGWYSLNVKKNYLNSIIYAFEPSPVTFKKLENNLLLNNIKIDKIENIGLFDQEGKLDFYFNEIESGSSSLTNIREDENVKKIQVNVTKLDNWVKDNKIEKLDFIKCDVEGAEYFIYKGGIETIKKFKPVIFSEMLRKWSKKFGYHPNDIIEFLKNVGYNCYVINSNLGLTEIKEVTEETVETNFFFLNQENHKDIINSLCK